MGVQFASKISGCSAQERDFERNIGIILRMLRTGAQFSSEFSRCPARERDFERRNRRKFEDAPHGGAIFNSGMNLLVNSRSSENGDFCFIRIFRMLRGGAQFSIFGPTRRA